MRSSLYLKLSRDSSERMTYFQSALQCLYRRVNCSYRHRCFCVTGIQYNGILRSPWCSKHQRFVGAENYTPAAVLESSINWLDQAVWSDTAMRIRCLSSCAGVTFRYPLLDLRLVHFSFSATCRLASLSLNCAIICCMIGKKFLA